MLSNEEKEELIRHVYEKCGYKFVSTQEVLAATHTPWAAINALRAYKQLDCLGEYANELIPLNQNCTFRVGESLGKLIDDLCDLNYEHQKVKKVKSKNG